MATLTNEDREHLRQMMAHPGYRVWQMIADSYIETMQDVATSTSQLDPLKNRDQIAEQWAMIAASKGYRTALDAGVKFELVLLNMPMGIPQNEIDTERQRIWDTLGMLEPMPQHFHRRGDE